jgi:serine/threonine protein kinase
VILTQASRPPSASGSAETLPGTAVGTPAYMSPEQAAGDLERVGPRSDVYSLAATLYCLLTGATPFRVTMSARYWRRCKCFSRSSSISAKRNGRSTGVRPRRWPATRKRLLFGTPLPASIRPSRIIRQTAPSVTASSVKSTTSRGGTMRRDLSPAQAGPAEAATSISNCLALQTVEGRQLYFECCILSS